MKLSDNNELNSVNSFTEDNSSDLPMSNGSPIRDDSFELTEEAKIDRIEKHFRGIMDTLGLDLKDDRLMETPRRLAKMYVKEIFKGLNPDNKPAATLFDNEYKHCQMLVERNIEVQSTCEHHFQPIVGKVHLAYIPHGKVIGLYKLDRIVAYYASRPQVQERLTRQIADELCRVLNTEDIAVYVEARHMSMETRGGKHQGAETVTTEYRGKFLNENVRHEFLSTALNR